jgi:uncharacterized protein (DUF58 family)
LPPATTPRPDGVGLELDGAFLQRLEYLNVIAKKIMSGRMRADRKSFRKGVSAEFADHRSYVAGDDIRHVDWHLFGRLEEVFMKLYREEENLHMTLLVDASLSMDRGRVHKLKYALEVAAALAYIGMSNLDAVNVLPFGERLREGRWALKGKAKVFELFGFLREIVPRGATDLAATCKELVGRERRRGVVIVISDFYDLDGFQPALKFLRYRKHDIYVIHVVDQEEREPDLRGDLRLVDSETAAFREINVTDALLAKYRKAFEDLAAGIESFCVRNEIGYVRALTEVPFDELVLRILRRGGLVG